MAPLVLPASRAAVGALALILQAVPFLYPLVFILNKAPFTLSRSFELFWPPRLPPPPGHSHGSPVALRARSARGWMLGPRARALAQCPLLKDLLCCSQPGTMPWAVSSASGPRRSLPVPSHGSCLSTEGVTFPLPLPEVPAGPPSHAIASRRHGPSGGIRAGLRETMTPRTQSDLCHSLASRRPRPCPGDLLSESDTAWSIFNPVCLNSRGPTLGSPQTRGRGGCGRSRPPELPRSSCGLRGPWHLSSGQQRV